jgi:hypothetical protein
MGVCYFLWGGTLLGCVGESAWIGIFVGNPNLTID